MGKISKVTAGEGSDVITTDWIGNKLQRQKNSIQQPAVSSSASKPEHMQLKGPSAYKMFCKGKSLGPTFVQWENEWKHLPASEKATYQETAEERRQNLSASVDTPKFIRHHLKLISQSRPLLQQLLDSITGDSISGYKFLSLLILHLTLQLILTFPAQMVSTTLFKDEFQNSQWHRTFLECERDHARQFLKTR